MSRGFHLFSDYFARRDNVLQRLDVRLKMGVAIALFAAILCSTRPVLPVSAWLLSIATMIALEDSSQNNFPPFPAFAGNCYRYYGIAGATNR